MSSAPQEHIIIDKVSRFGIISQRVWTYTPTQKVSELLQTTFPEWRHYRLAYGVGVERHIPPKLKWATPLSLQYDPSSEQLFKGIYLDQEQNYYLLISQLAEGIRDLSIRNHPHNASNIESCLWRYWDLYKPPAATRPVAPTSLLPLAKRLPDTPADGGAKRGVSRAKSQDERHAHLREKLAALKTLELC